jgi:3-methyl-2-oxobutanoate hydroxymethyltransferase
MKKVTIRTLARMRAQGEKVVMVTAYDATMARILDDAGTDVLLVGDSLGMVVQGHDSTLPVTLDHVVYHTAAVRRGAKRAHVVADMPFMSYQAGLDEAVKNAGRLVAEGGAESVKLEGGVEYADVVQRIVRAGIPVMGHIGLTPQSVHKLGGYVVQGKSAEQAERLLEDALALEAAGCYALVLECVPMEVAEAITEALRIPTIGIGAGAGCSGQVLVCYDLLGFNPDFAPKFVKRFADGYGALKGAAEDFVTEVRSGAFPAPEHGFAAPAEAAPKKRPAVRLVEGTSDEGDEGPGRLYGGRR